MSPTAPAPRNAQELETLLSEPDEATLAALDALRGDVLVLGAGGKMGPTVARMARRAISGRTRRVIAVSRFSNADAEHALQAHGVETIRCDLADAHAVSALPRVGNVVYMAGQKFGTSGDPVATWTQNVVASVHAAEHFAASRIVCFSTGNVYARTVGEQGSLESDALAPQGDYAASCVGRERVFSAIARRHATPLLLYRLFYACDLRYGVVTDIARKVLAREPIDVSMARANVIWQGDANRLALRALGAASVPAVALNVTGPIVRIRDIATRVGAHAGVQPHFVGEEQPDALAANVDLLSQLLPHDAMPLDTLAAWAVQWIEGGGHLLGKPTKFEQRDGRY